MTRSMAIKWLKWIQNMFSEDSEQYKALQFAINSMEVDEAYQLEYESTAKNDKVDCEHTDCNNCVNHKYCDYEPTIKNDLPHCQCTDAEIAKSFIEDVEAVEDLLPCGQMMDFPNTFDEFAKDYGFKDKDEIYTNGIELIPVYRVKQWLEHISATKNDLEVAQNFISDITEKISEQVTESREEFIFETIRPYCENVVQMKISKRELEQALLKYYGKNDLGVDCIGRQAVLDLIADYDLSMGQVVRGIHALPSVTPQVPKCKECKWWKDSDGEYRRGCGAESQCPINRREVFEGNGYCFLFEPQESEDDK